MVSKQFSKLTTMPVGKAIWAMALPMMTESVVVTTLNLTDMFWVGKLGPDALASAGIVGILLITFSSLAFGFGMAVQAIVARRIGENDGLGAADTTVSGVVVGLVAGITITGIVLALRIPLLKLFNPSPSVFEFAKTYFLWIFLGGPVRFVSTSVSGSLKGAGLAKQSLIASGTGVMLNIILDPLLIFGWFGFPKWGVAGAAIATVISEALSLVLMLIFYMRLRPHLTTKKVLVEWLQIKNVIKIGLPSSLMVFVRMSAAAMLMTIVSRFGMVTVAAYTVVTRIQEFVMLPIIGMGNAVATLVGQNLGAGLPDRAEKSVWLGTVYNSVIIVTFLAIFVIFRNPLISLFNNSPDVVSVGGVILMITAIGNVIQPLGFVPIRGLTGAGDTVTAMFINLGVVWIFQVPFCWWLSTIYGTSGIWWGINSGAVVSAILAITFFKLGRWKRVKV